MQQPAQSSVRTIGKSKPLTLNSLGAGKIGYSGSKSLSAAAPVVPTPVPVAEKVEEVKPVEKAPVETPIVEEKKEEPVQPVATPETPEESVDDQTPSVVGDNVVAVIYRPPIYHWKRLLLVKILVRI